MAELRRRRSVSQAHLLRLLESQLADLVTGEWRPLDVVDLGGGTGVIAIPLAARGRGLCRPNPMRGGLERRPPSPATGRIAAGAGGPEAGPVIVSPGRRVSANRVLEVIEVPAEALLAMGTTSTRRRAQLLAAQRHASVLSRRSPGTSRWPAQLLRPDLLD